MCWGGGRMVITMCAWSCRRCICTIMWRCKRSRPQVSRSIRIFFICRMMRTILHGKRQSFWSMNLISKMGLESIWTSIYRLQREWQAEVPMLRQCFTEWTRCSGWDFLKKSWWKEAWSLGRMFLTALCAEQYSQKESGKNWRRFLRCRNVRFWSPSRRSVYRQRWFMKSWIPVKSRSIRI